MSARGPSPSYALTTPRLTGVGNKGVHRSQSASWKRSEPGVKTGAACGTAV
jgi:hypothetical protein